MDGDYIHKYDLLRNYVQLIVHEALKVKPQGILFKQNNASVRLTALFIELLERQFPIGSTEHILELKNGTRFCLSAVGACKPFKPCCKRSYRQNYFRAYFQKGNYRSSGLIETYRMEHCANSVLPGLRISGQF